ncbi:MAG: glutamate--cysteine ligase [Proteobacteria bacterium]|nr:glutamate--cysteine ligase [Pseudomonadota bacterium]
MSGIYQLLTDRINSNGSAIEEWFRNEFSKSPALFYNSVDLRCSGFKIAPIDTNCFPAGFNSLSDASKKKAKEVIDQFFNSSYPQARKILVIPESHTRNIKYLENILALSEIIACDGKREVIIGSLIADIEDIADLDIDGDRKVRIHKISNFQGQIRTNSGFVPDLIINNNDFTNQPEEMLYNVAQDIIPSHSLGWFQRRKSIHFSIYDQIVAEFGALFNIDPWLISAIDDDCDDVNFKERKGVDCLAKHVDEVTAQIREKYNQYSVKNADPYCYIKADNGTYGIAMMTARSGEEVYAINKKERNKMNMLKGNVINSRIIIQEGIPTIDRVKNTHAEPMIYLINGQVVGNLFRINDKRDHHISLNAAGMSFHDITNLADSDLHLSLKREEMVKIYSLIARLAALAAAREKY